MTPRPRYHAQFWREALKHNTMITHYRIIYQRIRTGRVTIGTYSSLSTSQLLSMIIQESFVMESRVILELGSRRRNVDQRDLLFNHRIALPELADLDKNRNVLLHLYLDCTPCRLFSVHCGSIRVWKEPFPPPSTHLQTCRRSCDDHRCVNVCGYDLIFGFEKEGVNPCDSASE